MAGRGGLKEQEMDPEEQMRRKFRAKCLFRALGRMVMANVYWLMEATDHYEGLDDVKRRVEQAVRSKGKKKQLLGIHDKTLLNKAAEDRTDQEKKYLFRIIGGLKCFKRYPNHVKKKLAAVTYFKYYGPGRTIVRQHHEAHALYFIVSGDVVVSQMVFDDLLQQFVSIDVGVMHPGDMFGEVSLLHNIPRTATVTTTGHCELLVLMKEDFKNVLQASIQKQWDEVLLAMSAFTYFDALDEVARREGCIVAKMKSYAPNETLLGDGVGVANFVYFILSGTCQMIESMQVTVTTRLGRNYYALYDPYIPVEESEKDFEAKYFGELKTEKESSSEIAEPGKDEGNDQVKLSDSKNVRGSLKDMGSASRLSTTSKQERVSIYTKTETEVISERAPSKTDASDLQRSESRTQKSVNLLKPAEQDQRRPSVRLSVKPELRQKPPENLHTYFMQVCQFNPGSSFGFGENMRDRRIVALTPVMCMLLPKIWLLQRNIANIWTRLQHYLEKKFCFRADFALVTPLVLLVSIDDDDHLPSDGSSDFSSALLAIIKIPTKKQLFKDFVASRRWSEFKDQLVSDVVSRSHTVNWTSVNDVPYSIRMEEMLDL